MRFSVLLYAWVVLIPVTVWPFQLNPTAKTNQADTDHPNKVAKSSSPLANNPEPTNTKTHPTKETCKSEPKSVRITEPTPNGALYEAYVIATIILAVIGAIGICVALRTLEAIKKQAVYMRIQARVSHRTLAVIQKQVEIQISIERPWVIAWMLPMERETIAGQPIIKTTCEVKNVGNTPAFILSWGAKRVNLTTDEKRGSGTCERIGFTSFGTMYFHQLTLWITDGNSISSHVPDTLSPLLAFL